MITTPLLREIVPSGAVTRVIARGVPGGYVLAVQIGMNEQLVEAQRGGARRFRKLDALARYVKSVGLRNFDVDVADWDPDGLL